MRGSQFPMKECLFGSCFTFWLLLLSLLDSHPVFTIFLHQITWNGCVLYHVVMCTSAYSAHWPQVQTIPQKRNESVYMSEPRAAGLALVDDSAESTPAK